MEEYWVKASDQLMHKLYRDKCIQVACNSERSANAWLSTIPHLPELQLSDTSVAAGLRLRLLKSCRLDWTQRKVIHQRMVNEFKKADYECKLVTTSTNYTSTDDPTRISDSIVTPMAISVQNLNLALVNTKDVPQPPPNKPKLLQYYRKRLHQKATKLQRIQFKRHYPGHVHFPFVVTTSGALMGKSEKWITELKRRSRLNKTPSPITQLISTSAIQAIS